ncbi:MAG: hypothetical protein IJP61_05885 [Treponema sp.]|nr:hypothetical protein [Treponema sp.]
MMIKFFAAAMIALFQLMFFSCDSLFDSSSEGTTEVIPVKEKPAPQIPKWTFIVYMAADNNLESAAISDLNEMEEASSFLSENTILVLLDRASGYDATNGDWNDTRLFRVSGDSSVPQSVLTSERISCPELGLSADSETELDMANKETLSNLLAFARREYKAEHYALIVWGHGNGWRGELENKAFAADSFSDSCMSICDLRMALDEGMDGSVLDFVGFDTCFGNCLELCYELSSSAQFLAGTPALVPSGGWNYTELFSSFAATSLDCEELSRCCSEQFKKSYSTYAHACFSVVNLQKLREAALSFDSLMQSAADLVWDDSKAIAYSELCRKSVRSYCAADFPCDYFLDAKDFSKKIATVEPALSDLCAAVSEDFDRALVSSWSADGAEISVAVFYSVFEAAGCPSCTHPPLYVNSSRETGQCMFVSELCGYVPTALKKGSFLDKVFYKEISNDSSF